MWHNMYKIYTEKITKPWEDTQEKSKWMNDFNKWVGRFNTLQLSVHPNTVNNPSVGAQQGFVHVNSWFQVDMGRQNAEYPRWCALKSKVKELTRPSFRTYSKAMLIKAVELVKGRLWNRIESLEMTQAQQTKEQRRKGRLCNKYCQPWSPTCTSTNPTETVCNTQKFTQNWT